ncbi:NYN domain-containing protein [Vibrio tapetis subsp. quintayensis]|uniref:LabA-like NYN domain-containing protein n=1 Tax=Vibrio tapetis TaxID=52443 RepID=UPI0025B5DD1B|nr:NYN domain-containing protein [Vibrio tapetis]MDN3680671.1 NYN domain-containing protein [Vibrio tapetis subsp. quintayensis]
MEKVAILVDVQNVYYTCKETHRKNFDYNTFWRQATKGKEVVQAFAYAISSTQEKQRQFHHILRGIGFKVQLKPCIQRSDGSTKADWDVGIAIDAIEIAPEVDTIILVSGDGDFDVLARRVTEKYGKRFEVYGVHALTAQSLIEAATQYTPIEGELLL